MEKTKFVDKNFWGYFWLCAKESGKEWLIHFEGWKKVTEPIGVAITTAVLTLISQRLFNGALKMSDINIALISVIGAPTVWLGLVYLAKLLFSPFRLYKQQEGELEKYKWSSVLLKIASYSMLDGSKGWALIIKNKKSIPVKGFYLNALEISSRGKIVFHHNNKLAWFGYINQDDGNTRQKIVFPREINLNAKKGESRTYSQTLESGKEYVFVLTKYLNSENQILFTSPEPINVVPRNIVMELKMAGVSQDNNETYYPSDKLIEILFDETGKPKILS